MKCKKCGLIKENDKFITVVGKTLDKKAAYNLICQYGKESIDCLNEIKSFDKNSDNWGKRLNGN